MAQPYVGEIRMFGGNFAPVGWMFCDGQLLPISENETLFQLIGTTYGGDGESTFALPNLQGRVPLHQGNGFILAETGGLCASSYAAGLHRRSLESEFRSGHDDHQHRRQSAAREHAAVPVCEFHHFAVRHISESDLRGASHGRSFCC